MRKQYAGRWLGPVHYITYWNLYVTSCFRGCFSQLSRCFSKKCTCNTYIIIIKFSKINSQSNCDMPRHLSRYYGFLISDSPPLQNLRRMSDHICYFPSGSERQDFRLSGNGWEGQYPWPGPVTFILYTNFVYMYVLGPLTDSLYESLIDSFLINGHIHTVTWPVSVCICCTPVLTSCVTKQYENLPIVSSFHCMASWDA